MFPLRLNKFLAEAGYCSRREADRLIETKKVTINGKKAVLGDKVTAKDKVKVNGKNVALKEKKKLYIAFHKPFGVISSTDPNTDNNLVNFFDLDTRLYPIGSLDVETSGLLLLTNDGDTMNKIAKAKQRHEKEYMVTVDKPLTGEMMKRLEKGVFIMSRKTLPSKVIKISPTQFRITIMQDMNRQVRSMCEAVGYTVKILKLMRIMNIHIGELARGKWRLLTEEEAHSLMDLTKNLHSSQK